MFEEYQRLLDDERLARDAAFLPIYEEQIAGWTVRQLTLRHLLILRMCKHPLLFWGPVDAPRLAAFLWLLSPGYKPAGGFRRWLFLQRCRRAFLPATNRRKVLRLQITVAAAREWLGEQLADRVPARSGAKDGPSYYSDVAELCATMAREFGWDDDRTLDKPIRRLQQYNRIAARQAGIPLFNPSDEWRRDFLIRINEQKRQIQ